MKSRNQQKALVAGLLVAFILVTAWFVQTRYSPVPSFEWNVQIGDTFTFLVTVHTSVNYTELNNTQVTVQITWLPTLDNNWSASDFTISVLKSTKTSLLLPIVHENGTEIISSFTDSINSVISGCILPIGGWNALDHYYPDESDPGDYGFTCDTHFSYFENSIFSIGYMWFDIDAGFGWEGQVEQSTGVPREIRIWKVGLHSPFEAYRITLLLQ